MLHTLTITNYVIIDRSEIRFTTGLNMITGETGAGKSVLLGALGLILGRRADTQVLFDPEQKAIVEAIFTEVSEDVHDILRQYELDEIPDVVLRREIAPNGRSRAFINDSPVTLDTMTEVGAALMDVHQQFDTLEIQAAREQYFVLDAYCGIRELRETYTSAFDSYSGLQKQLELLREQQISALKEKDYLEFQLAEFEALQLEPGTLTALEEEFQLQSGAEGIKAILGELSESLSGDRGMTDQLRAHLRSLSRYAQDNSTLSAFVQSITAIVEQCEDLSNELRHFEEGLDPDPRRREQIEEKLNIINRIMMKHGAQNESELVEIKERLQSQLDRWTHLDHEIAECESQIAALHKRLVKDADRISSIRRKEAPKLAKLVSKGLHDLAMKNATLDIQVTESDNLHSLGKDRVEFLFAPNLGSELKPVKKVASGGELSRLNLCLKSVVSDQMEMPSLVFDEIDAGVSGEVALRMGQKLKALARDHQVIMITHSPQIAAQAGHHLQVSKSDIKGRSIARIRELVPADRITEIAKMLSGDPPTEAAILNAKTLIET